MQQLGELPEEEERIKDFPFSFVIQSYRTVPKVATEKLQQNLYINLPFCLLLFLFKRRRSSNGTTVGTIGR